MKNLFLSIQIICAISLITLILIQSKGSGIGSSFGSGSGTSFTRRGLERLIFKATFFLAGLFILISIIQVVF